MKSEGKLEQPQQIAPETSSLEVLELKANLNPKQKDYLEKLKAKIKKISGNKTPKELAQDGDLESLKKYKVVLDEILEFLRTKEMKEESGDIEDDPDRVNRQLGLIDEKIKKTEVLQGASGWSKQRADEINELKQQKKLIAQPRMALTAILAEDEVEIYAKTAFSERSIWDLINTIENLSDDALFLLQKYVDTEGRIVHLRLGVAANLDIKYDYYLAGKIDFEKTINNDTTLIGKDVKFMSGQHIGAIATYDEKQKKWIY